MPIVTDYNAVRDIYRDAAERRISLPVFCAEDRETLEAILAAALKTAEAVGREDIPVIPAWTCRYPARGQMRLISACGDPVLGMHLMMGDLAAFMGPTSPYRRLRVLPHLDHAFPWIDGDVMRDFADRFASIMCDASEKPFEENMRLTAEYAERVRGRVLVEGAVDEICEAGNGAIKNELTTAAQAERFLAATGVDVLVPNVGTEHRAAAGKAHYHGDRARAISRKVGSILCLHGTSSVNADDLSRLPGDGFVKVNIYTILAVRGGQAVARRVLSDLCRMFTTEQLRELVREGTVSERVLACEDGASAPAGPRLASVANPPRRDAWFAAVRDTCAGYFERFNYQAFGK
ncbi:MAG: class II fructose-bisphosphate aldolase [Kiritimatiellae bacterium]|nr:class II fructose-bisphosphate aldolase [Kiritimatiellia bacterium]